MGDIILRGRILKWGNSAGIRISREELIAIGLRIGQEAELRLVSPHDKVDLSRLPVVHPRSGPRDVARRHDEYIGKSLTDKLKRRTRDARRRH